MRIANADIHAHAHIHMNIYARAHTVIHTRVMHSELQTYIHQLLRTAMQSGRYASAAYALACVDTFMASYADVHVLAQDSRQASTDGGARVCLTPTHVGYLRLKRTGNAHWV